MAGSDLFTGTLDILILKAVAWGPTHGYGIARWIEHCTKDTLQVEEGTLYPALYRIEQTGWIDSKWGTSENNRRARFYSITRAGRKQLAIEADLWSRTVAMMSRMLGESSS
jgi:transcriptional regulator